MYLILDDQEDRYEGFCEKYPKNQVVWCKTVADFWKAIYSYGHYFQIISLDHDLGDAWLHGTGVQAAQMLVTLFKGPKCSARSDVFIHSANPVGAFEMETIFKESRESEDFLSYQGRIAPWKKTIDK